MDEMEIKARFLELVRAASHPRRKPVVASEFKISSGNTRADLAILSDEFVGIEIKSKRDSLSRLIKQANDYKNYFDRTVLVLDGKHLVRYLSMSLDFCDVWTFDENGHLRQFSQGNHEIADATNLFSLLTQQERGGSNRNKRIAGMSKRSAFEQAFRDRYSKTSTRFWRTVARRRIQKSDVMLLSRYQDARTEVRKLELEKSKQIAAWIEAQSGP